MFIKVEATELHTCFHHRLTIVSRVMMHTIHCKKNVRTTVKVETSTQWIRHPTVESSMSLSIF